MGASDGDRLRGEHNMTKSKAQDGGGPAAPSNQNGSHWWDFIAPVSAILAAVASAAYALGLFSVWIPLASNYTSDLTSAWYMAGLVPRTVVLGQGVSKLLVPPILLWLLLEVWMVAGSY